VFPDRVESPGFVIASEATQFSPDEIAGFADKVARWNRGLLGFARNDGVST
jgi:hypothetical protein